MSKNQALKELKGTKRQIQFATDVRRYVLYQLENASKQGLDQRRADKVAGVLKRTTNAKFILDTFAGVFYNHCVLDRLDVPFIINRELDSAKALKQVDLTGYSPAKDAMGDEPYNIKDVPFEDSEAKNNEIISHNTKLIKSYLKYLSNAINRGYYKKDYEEKIIDAIDKLKKADYDTKEYQLELIKLKPKQYIFNIDNRLGWLQDEPHTDKKILSLADEVEQNIKSLDEYNSNVKELSPEQIEEYQLERFDTKNFEDRLADALKNAKRYSNKKSVEKDKDDDFLPWFISDVPYKNGAKLIRGISAVKVVSSERRYLSYGEIESMKDLGALNEWDDYPTGNYYIIRIKNIDDTNEGKELLAKYHAEQKAKKKRQQHRQKLSDELRDFVDKRRDSKNFPSEKEFDAKYEDKFSKAETIYKGKEYMLGLYDYLAVKDGMLFIAYYNGLDGDNWSYNNYGSYRIWVAKISDEELDRLQQIIKELAELDRKD